MLTATLRAADGSVLPVERSFGRPLVPAEPLIGLRPLFEGEVDEGGIAAFEAIARARPRAGGSRAGPEGRGEGFVRQAEDVARIAIDLARRRMAHLALKGEPRPRRATEEARLRIEHQRREAVDPLRDKILDEKSRRRERRRLRVGMDREPPAAALRAFVQR
jgi:hypothetical protein